jgi:predicted AAA+ superfamily ATPase
LFQEYLLNNGVKENQIQSINLENPDFKSLLNWETLYNHINQKLLPDKKNYIFIDEIQNVEYFQKAADGLFIKKNVDLYLTGSNSQILSGKWATLLSGRYIEIQMLPLSFKEYISAFEDKTDIAAKYASYLETGAFPYLLQLSGDRKQRDDYLRGIYNTIILKDIVEYKKIADVGRLERVVRFMADNIGNLTSIKNVSDAIFADVSSAKEKRIYPQTIETYIDALIDGFIFYKVPRFDIKGKQYLKINDKYYITDIGLRYFLLGSQTNDFGQILENIAYLELLRRGYRIYVGKIGDKEVDFVADSYKGLEYYQVSLTILDKNTLKRELAPLEAIKDHNPKFLLTTDYLPNTSYNGIKHINVFDWLLGSDEVG